VDDVARVVLAVETPEVAEEVLHFLDRSGRARVVATAADDRQLSEAARQCEPDAVVAEPVLMSGGFEGAVPLLALATRETVGALRAAVRAGAKGFYVWPGERDGLLEAVAGCGAARRVPERRATVVAVHAGRGAAGCTFLATHLAEAFRRSGRSCVLIDADLTYGDIGAALGAEGEDIRTLSNLVPVADELAWSHVEDVLTQGAVLAPPVGALDDRVAGSLLRGVVQVAASASEVVVLGLPRELGDLTRWCLAEADRIVEVLTLDVMAFRAARRLHEALEPLALDDRRAIVVNRTARGELTVVDVRRAFGVDPLGVVPADPGVPRAQDRGRLLAPRGRTWRTVERLAAGLMAPGDQTIAS
jgi:Flp pilus assembly CpaE family ATPase